MTDELLTIQNKIYEIRGQRVMLDFDLAAMYQVETRSLKQSVRRNIERFPEDFMSELSGEEYKSLKDSLRSQIVMLDVNGRGKFPQYAPFAFTEMGVAMLSSVLRRELDMIYQAIAALSVKPQQPSDSRRPIGFKK